MARRRTEPRVFFPWERKRGIVGALARARIRQVLLVLGVIVAIILLRRREEHAAAVRATRATITTGTHWVDAYRADHGGTCPKTMTELVASGYAPEVPLDAWGHPLRLACPSRRSAESYDLSSDGPDGLPGGLDRVE